jgi:hypothetical protein
MQIRTIQSVRPKMELKGAEGAREAGRDWRPMRVRGIVGKRGDLLAAVEAQQRRDDILDAHSSYRA